jgi:hypothetical protein
MYEFEFKFTTREQFYGIVRLLNSECGKGNWTIKGKVLKGIKRLEKEKELGYMYSSYNGPSVNKNIIVPEKHKHVEAMIRFVYSDATE